MYAGMTREAWLAERKSGLGGSEIAAIMGLSPWATPVTVWLDKTGRSNPKEETEAMRIGTELEDLVARMYSEETGRTVRNYNTMVREGHLLGNFDRLVVPDGEKIASHMGEVRTDTVLECKTSSVDWEGKVPIYYQTQVQHYMGLVPRLRHADVACLFIVHKHFEIHRVERDDEVIAYMKEFAENWWREYVEGDKVPEPTSEEECKLIWAKSNPGKTAKADANVEKMVARLRTLNATAKHLEDKIGGVKKDIQAAMKDAETLLAADGKTPLATWKSGKDRVKSVVDWNAVATECQIAEGVILNHTTVETKPGARTFLLKPVKTAK